METIVSDGLVPLRGTPVEKVIAALEQGENVLIDAVAGGGKTTTVLKIAAAFPEKQIIQITYNASLKLEVREKAVAAGLENLIIHTYHSIAVNYYDKTSHTDAKLYQVLGDNTPPMGVMPNCDILVIDETQDQTVLYFKLVKKFLRDIGSAVQIIVLGDKYQGIYSFKGADTRFLTMAEQVWQRRFTVITMNRSYRVTKPIAEFINRYLIGDARILSDKPGCKVQYLKHNIWEVHNVLVPEILDLLQSGAAVPGDFFVLAGSVRSSKAPIRRLENALVMHGIKCFIPIGDTSNLDTDVIKNKVIFSSLHQSKGRERKIVILYGFDENYFEFYARGEDRNVCPATVYVGASRALERLYVIEGERQQPMPFLKEPIARSNDIIDYRFESCGKKDPQPKILGARRLTPTELVRFLSDKATIQLQEIVTGLFTEIVPESEPLNIPGKVDNTDGSFEEVSDINALAIQTMYEAIRVRRMARSPSPSPPANGVELDIVQRQRLARTSIQKALLTMKLNPVDHLLIINCIKKMPKKCRTINDWLYVSNIYNAVTEGIFFKLVQIDNYNWLDPDVINECHSRMDSYVEAGCDFEKDLDPFEYKHLEFGEIIFTSRVDFLSNTSLWEFKCTDTLQLEHYLQLIVYAWIWKQKMEPVHGPRTFKIMNIKTGQIKELKYIDEIVSKVMDILLKNTFGVVSTHSDADFLKLLGAD